MLTMPETSSTAGASSHKTASVRLWPYAPGVYGRDALYRVWKLMEDDGATKQAFWDETDPATGADLASFVRLFSGQDRRLLMIERVDTGKLCGCFWVSQMQLGHQAFVGMWMQTSARGRKTDEAARLALRWTFEHGVFRQLWALTPWTDAKALCRRMGFRHVAELPEFCQWRSDYRTVHLLRLTKEAYDGLDVP